MKRLRLAAALLCALLMLSLPVMADGFGMGDFDSDTVNKNPQVDNPNEVTPTPSTEPPQEPTGDGAGNNAGDAAGTNSAGTENGNSSQLDDGLWGDWSDPGNSGVRTELPSKEQQELEEARRELEEKQQQRDEAFREAERENAALPEEGREAEEARRQQGGRCRPHRTGAAPAGSENRQPGAVHPHRGAAGRGPLHCHLPVYPPGAGGRPRR